MESEGPYREAQIEACWGVVLFWTNGLRERIDVYSSIRCIGARGTVDEGVPLLYMQLSKSSVWDYDLTTCREKMTTCTALSFMRMVASYENSTARYLVRVANGRYERHFRPSYEYAQSCH